MTMRIFTDGSSRGNPGPGGWGAILEADGTVVELGGSEGHTTNNRMELAAAANALEWAKGHGGAAAAVHSDSKYVVKGMTEWVAGWKRNGWKTAAKKDVGNRDLWERLAAAAGGLTVSWVHVDGHAGVPANERCDEIATMFADGMSPELYSGPAKLYGVDLSSVRAAGPKKPSKKSSASPAYSYVSLVDGKAETHKTWAECFARTRGVSGARFKKAANEQEEKAILKEFLS